jgi:hypothetical protein
LVRSIGDEKQVTGSAASVRADHQIGSAALNGRYEPTATYIIATLGRSMSALVATTLDLAQKIVAKPSIVAAIAKLVFLRMGASDFRGRETCQAALVLKATYADSQTSGVIQITPRPACRFSTVIQITIRFELR